MSNYIKSILYISKWQTTFKHFAKVTPDNGVC